MPRSGGVGTAGCSAPVGRSRRIVSLGGSTAAPSQGLGVLHRCDTPLCVNPSHLFLGTNADNTHDAQAKGRLAAGDRHLWRRQPERHPMRVRPELKKLREEEVRVMRGLRGEGATYAEIAEHFGANVRTVTAAVRGISWRWVR